MADTTDTSGFIVQCLRLGISGSAGLRNASPYMVKSHVPMYFDFDKPSAYLCTSARREQPTVFASEKEAKEKVEDLLARVKAIIRIGERTGKWTDIGHATSMIARDYGGGLVGGWEVVPYAGWAAEREEEQRFYAAEAREQLAHADSEVRAAQQKADKVRAELGEVKATATPSTSSDVGKWIATDTPKVQVYKRKDGTQSFRARTTAGNSPNLDTIDEAVRWLEGERGPEKASPDRTAAMEGLRDKMVRS